MTLPTTRMLYKNKHHLVVGLYLYLDVQSSGQEDLSIWLSHVYRPGVYGYVFNNDSYILRP
jgi:flavin-dependent dehydrogenase